MDKLTPEQKPLYEDMKKGIKDNFKGFTAINENDQLIGPWNPWLRFPQFGKPVWELTKAMSFSPKLPRPIREIAILVTGAKFHAAYEIYAHVLAAELRGLPDRPDRDHRCGPTPEQSRGGRRDRLRRRFKPRFRRRSSRVDV